MTEGGNPQQDYGQAGGGGGQFPAQMQNAHAQLTNQVSWKILFFAGAVDVFAGGVLAVIMGIQKIGQPFTFTSEVFLLLFGLVMIVLDTPLPKTEEVKDLIYKHMLFLTRFTGRGFWYMYLGTMIWAALYDSDSGVMGVGILGIIMSLYAILLGIAATFQGVRLSLRLGKVRKQLLSEGRDQHGPLNKQQFGDLCKQAGTEFNDNDLAYVINGLSLTAQNDGAVSDKELKAWLAGNKDDSLLQLI